VIRQAREGVYGAHSLRGVSERLRQAYFQPVSSGRYRVRDALRGSVFFEARALADEPPGAGKHDAIVCRGLLSRLPPTARTAALEKLGACLKPGGYLLLGREDHAHAVAAPLSLVLLGRDVAYRAPGAVVYTRPPL
jgi:chemotaxis protein methyltransferase CheR